MKRSIYYCVATGIYTLFLLVFIGINSTATGQTEPQPYFQPSYYEDFYYAPGGTCIRHLVGKKITNGGGSGDVFVNVVTDMGKSYSRIFYMDQEESVIVWLEVPCNYYGLSICNV